MTDEEKVFADTFARTFSVRAAAEAAGFAGRTAFARASRLMEREDVRAHVRDAVAAAGAGNGDSGAVGAGDEAEERILREYEKIAFADTSDGDIKVSDKLRALDQYRAIIDRRSGRGDADAGVTMVVNYDYGDR